MPTLAIVETLASAGVFLLQSSPNAIEEVQPGVVEHGLKSVAMLVAIFSTMMAALFLLWGIAKAMGNL